MHNSTVSNLLLLIDKRDRVNLLKLLGGILFLAVMETVSVVSIFPFISVILDPNTTEQNMVVSILSDFFGVSDLGRLTVFLGFAVIFFFVLSNLFSTIITWWTNKFVYTLGHRISLRMLENYLRLPYIFFLENNSSEMSKNILIEVRRVVNGIILPVMVIVTKIIIMAFIFTILFLADPFVTINIFFIVILAYLAIFFVIKNKLTIIGLEVTSSNGGRFQMASEAIQSVIPIKLTGKSKMFLDRFSVPSQANAEYSAISRVYEVIPRYIMEAVVFAGIILFILFSMSEGNAPEKILPLVTLFVVAAYRLMPAVQSIYQSAAKIRFNISALDVLTKHLSVNQEIEGNGLSSNKIHFNHSIYLKNIFFRYPSSSSDVLNNINICIEKNTTIGIAGSTGAGKSTFVDILLGLLKFNSGDITIDGVNKSTIYPEEWSETLSYVPQSIYLMDDTIMKNIAFGIADENIDKQRVIDAARTASIHDYIETLDSKYETTVGERGVNLSGGQIQRIGLARALYNVPEILILDESTSSLDNITESLIIDSINNISGKITIIIIAHRISTLVDCDVIHFFDEGRLVDSGDYNNLLEQNEKFKKMATFT